MDNVLRLPCRARWASVTERHTLHRVWTFAQNTAPASARLSTQDPLPEPRVGKKCQRELTPHTQPHPRFVIIFIS